jgi:hypothetical protein
MIFLEDCKHRGSVGEPCIRRKPEDPKASQSDYREASQSDYQRRIRELDCDIIEILRILDLKKLPMTPPKSPEPWNSSKPSKSPKPLECPSMEWKKAWGGLPAASGPNDQVRKFNLGYIDSAVKALQTARDKFKQAVLDFDPPIDTLSHQVQFVLTLTGSATPTWTLARFKGPGPASGGLLSGTQTNTHTLTIVLGSNQTAINTKVNAFAIGNAINGGNNFNTAPLARP